MTAEQLMDAVQKMGCDPTPDTPRDLLNAIAKIDVMWAYFIDQDRTLKPAVFESAHSDRYMSLRSASSKAADRDDEDKRYTELRELRHKVEALASENEALRRSQRASPVSSPHPAGDSPSAAATSEAA